MAERDSKSKCCSIKTMCGRSLCSGVVYVGFCTMTVTIIMLVLAVLNIVLIAYSESPLNTRPQTAMDLLFAMVVTGISVYQLIITALLLWQAVNTKGMIFLCSLWYVSHLSILSVYGVMFCARVFVCAVQKYYFTVCVTIIICIAYEGSFIYFAIVVNSFLHTLDHERYF